MHRTGPDCGLEIFEECLDHGGEALVRGAECYVLVVEDDVAIRNALADLIRDEHDCDVKIAGDGHAALELMRGAPPPALILLDLMMPGMNGVELVQQMNEIPAMAAIPVCIMTATSDLVRAMALPGVVSVLRKPFDIKALLTILARHLPPR